MDLRSTASRSSRSRSKTPFMLSTLDQEILKENHAEHIVSKSTRKSTITTIKTGNGSSTFDSISEDYSANTKYVKPSSTKRTTRSSKFHKTSDYSSEEGENEVSSTRSISENEKNRILEDARQAADTSSGITALGLYRKAKRYWDEYPKTDWTYSPFSKDRVEIAPGVVAMPNMSRRHISSYDKYTNTDSRSSMYSSSLRPQTLFSERRNSERSAIVNVVLRLIVTIVNFFFGIIYLSWRSVTYIYSSAHSVSLRIAKSIHRITSRVMLLDTWLLRKRRNGEKTTSLMALCLVPLLLLAGWWLLSSVGGNFYQTLFNRTSTTLPNLFTEDPVVKMEQNHVHKLRSSDHLNREWHEDNPNVDTKSIASMLSESQLEAIARHVGTHVNINEHIDQDEIINKIINSESLKKIINSYDPQVKIDTDTYLERKLERQQILINQLSDELNNIKIELMNLQDREGDMNQMKIDINRENVRRIDNVMYHLNKCCRRPLNIEPIIFKTLTSYLNTPDFLQKQENFKNWLRSLFVAKQDLEEKLSNLTEYLDSRFDKLVEGDRKILMDQVATMLNVELNRRTVQTVQGRSDGDISLTDVNIRRIVKDALTIYDADKTGLVDYAMEPMGGQIITTRCTESYHTGTAVVSVLGLPLWYPTSSPRTVITPGINPGKCWAFQNFPGLLVIKLMAPIKIEAFSLEHISRLLVPEGSIDSAPKDFEIYGLDSEDDKIGIKIGEYKYDNNGEPLQFFIAQNPEQVFEYIELRITSNHGNPNYTCLYRFRVHGKKQAKSS